ncbi:LuxR C-terminal-related transcriptional regulator [Streptomyces sp. NPDC058424]|uniref:LuxR C-terminal-related transcriptional regulator n=1 Tax=Streptomyces sp. NPDC058424 TaxID=3346491 RepID=UPI00365D852B
MTPARSPIVTTPRDRPARPHTSTYTKELTTSLPLDGYVLRLPLRGVTRFAEIPDVPRQDVLILTTFDLDEYVYGALRAGAAGFLLKDTSPEVLLAGIRTVAAGESLLAPSVTRRLIAEFARLPHAHHAPGSSLEDLTEREREVLVLVARGLSNADISEYLHLSNGTVKTYIGRLLSKLRARDRAQLVISAYESGLVSAAHQSIGF